jgi:hypothetical protein
VTRAHRLALAAIALCSLAAAPDPEDPPLCREALAAQPDAPALAALADEEKRLAIEARTSAREARKLMRKSLGAGADGAQLLPAYEALIRQQDDAKQRGKVICLCRERRKDPHREDCELLYPVRIR